MNNTKTIIYGVCGLLLAGVVFYLFSLAFTSLESMSAQSTQERLQEISIEEFDKGALHEQWRSLEGVYNNFKKDYLLKSERFDRFRMELQTLAQQNRLGTIRLESKYKSVFADVLQITMKVEFTGAYENIKKYIFDLSMKERMILLKKLHLSKQKVGPGALGKLELEVYVVR